VAGGWDAVNDFDAGATFPDSTQSAFEPIMANLRKDTDAAGAAAAGDEGPDNAAAKAAAVAVAGGAGATASSHSVPVGLPPLPGGNFGRSDAVDVPAALAHKFKRTFVVEWPPPSRRRGGWC
jgi:hypothetical protein